MFSSQYARYRSGRTSLLLFVLTALGCAEAHPDARGPAASANQAVAVNAPDASSADNSPIADAPIPAPASGNPFAGQTLWVNPQSQAAAQASALRNADATKAEVISKLAAQPSAAWLGEWSGNVKSYVSGIMRGAAGKMPVFVVYNLPYRDCGSYSKGGLAKGDAYRRWIREVASGIGSSPAAVVIEPDALGLLDKCLDANQQAERLALVRDAVRVLRQSPKTAAYIDAGHAHWVPAATMAERLKGAGIASASGFALNTSNYITTVENNQYGSQLSELVGGAHFVIDTSRNGNGSAPADEWCNPSGRKIGAEPSTATGNPLVDAWLWVKPPGESDGTCNGGPSAGKFWVEQALQLAKGG